MLLPISPTNAPPHGERSRRAVMIACGVLCCTFGAVESYIRPERTAEDVGPYNQKAKQTNNAQTGTLRTLLPSRIRVPPSSRRKAFCYIRTEREEQAPPLPRNGGSEPPPYENDNQPSNAQISKFPLAP